MVMKAAPPPALEMIQPQFVLELLIVALDAPAELGQSDEVGHGMVSGRVDSQYFVGSASPRGHSIRSHSSGRGADRFSSRCAGRTRTRAKRERIAPRVPSRQVTDAPRRGRQPGGHVGEVDRLMPRRPPHADGRTTPAPPPRLRGQGRLARRPHRGRPFDADDIGQRRRAVSASRNSVVSP